jgi:hypothetical protein
VTGGSGDRFFVREALLSAMDGSDLFFLVASAGLLLLIAVGIIISVI